MRACTKNKTALPIWCDLEEFGPLSAPIPNYFIFMRYVMLLLILIIGGNSVPNFLEIIKGDFVTLKAYPEPYNLIFKYTGLNKLNLQVDQQNFYWKFSPAIIVLFLVINHLLIRSQRLMEASVSEPIPHSQFSTVIPKSY